MKVIAAHPGKQHSYRLASALKKNGMLECYVTTIYSKSSSRSGFIRKLMPSQDQKRILARRNPDLEDDEVVTIGSFRGMLEAVIYRLDHGRDLYRFVQRLNADRFGKKLAKLAARRSADAVVLYDSTATACFRELKKHNPEIVRVLDVSIGARPDRKKIYEAEIARSGKEDFRREDSALWNERHMRRHWEELELTDFFLSPSSFVDGSLVRCGVDSSRIYRVPYGANVQSTVTHSAPSAGEPVRFLFVGTANYRKGIPVLLEALRMLPQDAFTVTLTGRYDPDSWYIKEAREMPNVTFTGAVLPAEMKKLYENADVFLLPSFTEGLSLAGVEAMACALPIICTENTGVNDYVREGENGFVIPAGDVEALADRMRWCIAHRGALSSMGAAARDAVRNLTWDKYEKNVTDAIRDMYDRKKGTADE
ncbi:MAG: glycosyltransferase family 4 protein [Oscillospiraceae bacterium]|nr:glycosyltransferase family 4 protein [Oscillospiraceae bacterium]